MTLTLLFVLILLNLNYLKIKRVKGKCTNKNKVFRSPIYGFLVEFMYCTWKRNGTEIDCTLFGKHIIIIKKILL